MAYPKFGFLKRNSEQIVLNMIPTDGKSIRFFELDRLRKEKQLGLGTLNRMLKKLVDVGLVQKEFVKVEHGVGTSYRRTITFPKLYKEGWAAFIREHKRRINTTEDPQERERALSLYFCRAFENYINIAFQTLKYASQKNPEDAKIILDIAGRTYLTGLLTDLGSLIPPGDKSEALDVVRAAFTKAEFRL